jgi:hypothetical protein
MRFGTRPTNQSGTIAMPRFERPFNSIEELHEIELDHLKTMFDSGVAVAVPAALHYCVEHGLDAPPWLMGAATVSHCALLRREKSKKRGRACGAVARYRQDMIDLARSDEVSVVRQVQKEFLQQVEELRALPRVPRELLEEKEKMLAWLGHTLSRAFECASMMLAQTEAFGSPEAMKRSYRQVERNSRDPKQAYRYHVLDHRFLRKLGIKPELGYGRGRKLVPLYDLTLR